MNRIHFLNTVMVTALTALLCGTSVCAHGSQSVDAETVSDDNAFFALDLYQQLKDTVGNLFFSPHSVSAALAMAFAGARGETESQMAEVLHFSKESLSSLFRSDVFPAPLRPMRAIFSPCLISRLTPSRAGLPPYPISSFASEISGACCGLF